MNTSKAQKLLLEAEAEQERTQRHLKVAAALGEVLSTQPIVVGGLAQQFYLGTYNPTDLDLCSALTGKDREVLSALGFERTDRHWFHSRTRVAVEFPEGTLAGDESRTLTVDVGDGSARLIGVDDLYLDRVKQATASEVKRDVAYQGALALAVSRFEDLDWKYIRERIRESMKSEPMTGAAMRKINIAIRREAQRIASEPVHPAP